jgi:protein-tyrosine phosphatase
LIDLHCHILPGVDDGPETWEQSLAMARLAEADGIETIVATPHCNLDSACPSPAQIRDLTAELNARLSEAGLRLRVAPGAEVRATTAMVEAVEREQVLTLGDRGRYLLVELPPSGHPLFAGEMFFRLQLAGITPVIAHAERYDFFRATPAALEELCARGYPVQVSVGSILGQEGGRVRRFAHELIQRNLATLIASDGHNTTDRKPVLAAAEKPLRLKHDVFLQFTRERPSRVLEETSSQRRQA